MTIDEMAQQLQSFSDANNLNLNIQELLPTVNAGDFLELSQAMDNSDNRAIIQILQKYRAQMSENYKYFSGESLIESENISFIDNMGYNELVENYRSFVNGSTYDYSHLSLAEMKTLVSEDITSTLASALQQNNVSSGGNNNPMNSTNGSVNSSQTQMDPIVAAKVKQAELQKNAGNTNFNVTVPGQTGGTSSVEQVLGIDVGQNPQDSLVVTKDPANNSQVQVFGMNDVEPVEEDAEDVLSTASNQEIGPLQDKITEEPYEDEVTMVQIPDMDDSEEDEAPVDLDEVLAQIMAFCSKVNEL